MITLRTRAAKVGLATLAIGSVFVLAACGNANSDTSTASSSVAKQNPDTLTIAVTTPPTSLNPILGGNGDPLQVFYELAYDPLIYQQPDGSFTPGLATKWGWDGTGNTVFNLTLRSGVKFSDGEPLTADGVKQFIEAYAQGGQFASRFQNVQSIDVTDSLSLTIKLKQPNPQFAYLLTQDLVTGDVVSPKGLANQKALGTSTAGAGQYVLDATKTVTNQEYVYTPNPNYWNPSAIHWKQINVKVLSNDSSALAAMKTGQVDYMFGTAQDADTAKGDGFVVQTQPYLFGFVSLLDRNGENTKALGDVRVRQALNYAIDRPAIAKALFGKYASPSDQLLLPGADGYDNSLNGHYAYDPAKAKELLAKAGYAKGFTMTMWAYNLQPGEVNAAQTIAAQWQAIGVTAKVQVPTDLNSSVNDLMAKKYASMLFEYGGQPMYLVASELLEPGFFNPYNSTDPTITSLMTKGAAASAKDGPAIYKQLQKELVDKAWFVPFASIDKVVIARPGLDGVKMSPDALNPNPVFFSAQK